MQQTPQKATDATDPAGDGVAPEECLQAYLQGDEEAFTQLVELLGPRLFGFLCRYLGQHQLAEDVYQTVWINVAQKAAAFDGRARLQTWIFQIARNAAIDALRKTPRQRMVPLDDGAENGLALEDRLAGNTQDPADAIAAEELHERILRAVDALPDEQREVFLLKENAGLGFDEIGAMLKCNRETAKSRMRYAVKRLQNALTAEARAFGVQEAGSADA